MMIPCPTRATPLLLLGRRKRFYSSQNKKNKRSYLYFLFRRRFMIEIEIGDDAVWEMTRFVWMKNWIINLSWKDAPTFPFDFLDRFFLEEVTPRWGMIKKAVSLSTLTESSLCFDKNKGWRFTDVCQLMSLLVKR